LKSGVPYLGQLDGNCVHVVHTLPAGREVVGNTLPTLGTCRLAMTEHLSLAPVLNILKIVEENISRIVSTQTITN
jgi:hypothetical protein